MDRMLYVAMSGAKHLFHKQEVLAHNLANANTTGFRAELDALRAVPAQGEGAGTRVFSVESTPGFDSTPGTVQQTGNPLDVAIQGEGWLAVQGQDGNEAYTRNGALVVGAEGQLRTKTGAAVMGDGGPITVPEGAKVAIASDGTVSVTQGRTSTNAGRLKLVNPPAADLQRGADGLFRTRDGNPAAEDANVRVVDGALEGSNVNVVNAMVGMISAARQFEMQMKMLTGTESRERDAAKLLSING
jgi:flagellar basal-body rod protein FlgF